MNLIINNVTPNVLPMEKNQKIFCKILDKKKHISLIKSNIDIKKNIQNNYFNKSNNKLLKII